MAYKHKLKAPSIPVIECPNWVEIVDHLRFREGYSMSGLARACHCSRETLYSVGRGVEPQWLVGACLLAIYQQAT